MSTPQGPNPPHGTPHGQPAEQPAWGQPPPGGWGQPQSAEQDWDPDETRAVPAHGAPGLTPPGQPAYGDQSPYGNPQQQYGSQTQDLPQYGPPPQQGLPQYGHPQQGPPPPYGQAPAQGQPQYGQPNQQGQPPYGPPPYGWPQQGQPQQYGPPQGQPQYGQPAPGQPRGAEWPGQQQQGWGQYAPAQQPGQQWSGQPQGTQQWGQGPELPEPVKRSGSGKKGLPLIIGGAVVVVAVIAVLGFVAPGFFVTRVFDAAALQDGVQRVLTQDYGLTGVAGVRCADGIRVAEGATFECDATADGAPVKVPVTVTGSDGAYEVGRPG
jgi:hypothetical protein